MNNKYLDFLFDSFRVFFQNLAYLLSTGKASRKLDIINFIPSAPFRTSDFSLSNNNTNNAYSDMIATNQYKRMNIQTTTLVNYHIARIFRGQQILLFLWISLLPQKLILENLIIACKCNDSLVDPQNLTREIF